jgi:hypothetical protein
MESNMFQKKIFIIIFIQSFLHMIFANDLDEIGLEKRVEILEKKIIELELKILHSKKKINLKNLKKGISKLKVQSRFGQPDRKGKFSNGDEIWGFNNYTLKFDNKGNLKNWSKPFEH